MRYFVLVINGPTDDQQKRVSEFCSSVPAGWWHHARDVWFLKDPSDHTATWWRDRVREIVPGPNTFVTQVLPMDWSALGSQASSDWLQSDWSPLRSELAGELLKKRTP